MIESLLTQEERDNTAVIIYRSNNPMGVEELLKRFPADTVLVMLDAGESIQFLSEEELTLLGWVRK